MIVVTTPTGSIGSKVAASLAENGRSFRVLARNPSRLEPAVRHVAEVVVGSSDDPSALAQAFRDAEVALWVTPPGSMPDGFTPYYERLARGARDAIVRAGVPRIVSISSGGYGVEGAGPVSALHAMERVLNESGAAMRHIRNGCFMENFLEDMDRIVGAGELAWPQPGGVKVPVCATRDIATIAVRWLTDTTWGGQEYRAVHGPSDLNSFEICAILGRSTGQTLRYRELGDDEYLDEMVEGGAPRRMAEEMLGMFRGVRNGMYAAEPRTVESTTATTLEQWASEAFVGQFNFNFGDALPIAQLRV